MPRPLRLHGLVETAPALRERLAPDAAQVISKIIQRFLKPDRPLLPVPIVLLEKLFDEEATALVWERKSASFISAEGLSISFVSRITSPWR
jgi:hypothetical protein